MEHVVTGAAMKRILKVVLATFILTGLSACVLVPPHAEYIGPRATIVAPYPGYPPYYGEPMHYHHEYRDWDRRW
jgi:hypothetical protein